MRQTLRAALLAVVTTSLAAGGALAQEGIKRGLTPEDWAYEMPEGVTYWDVSYYSDGVQAYAKLFFPADFDAGGSYPAVVLGQGWAGSHYSIEKYAARFAERGLVAMAIDYRGWGKSQGFVSLVNPIPQPADVPIWDDGERHIRTTAEVMMTRTRLLPMRQVEDYRAAISYIQGEPGVDPERIGVWGSSFAGGHSIMVAALDGRVKAVSVQVPSIGGSNVEPGPVTWRGPLLEDAIRLARTGEGAEMETGFSNPRIVDLETNRANMEYRPFHYLDRIGSRPVQFVVAEHEELFDNRAHAYAAMEVLTGPKNLISVPATHFQIYIDEAFEISSNAAADWFLEHL